MATTCNATWFLYISFQRNWHCRSWNIYIGNNAPYNNMGKAGMKSSDLDNANLVQQTYCFPNPFARDLLL